MNKIKLQPGPGKVDITKKIWYQPFPSFGLDSTSLLISACSSATKDVVILSNGTLNAFDTRLNTEAETPTAANSTAPA